MLQVPNVSELNVNVTESECMKRMGSTSWHVFYVTFQNVSVHTMTMLQEHMLPKVLVTKHQILQNTYVTKRLLLHT